MESRGVPEQAGLPLRPAGGTRRRPGHPLGPPGGPGAGRATPVACGGGSGTVTLLPCTLAGGTWRRPGHPPGPPGGTRAGGAAPQALGIGPCDTLLWASALVLHTAWPSGLLLRPSGLCIAPRVRLPLALCRPGFCPRRGVWAAGAHFFLRTFWRAMRRQMRAFILHYFCPFSGFCTMHKSVW